jgi:hypothetical protein
MSIYPNPISNISTISYDLPASGMVTLKIQSLLGQVLTTLVSEQQVKGKHTLKMDASQIPQGVYVAIIHLQNGNANMVNTMKIVVNK